MDANGVYLKIVVSQIALKLLKMSKENYTEA